MRQRLRRLYERPERLLQRSVPDPERCSWNSSVSFLAPGAQENRVEAITSGQFKFLNQEHNLGWPPADWDVPGMGKLWQYNLNYFDWLWALDYGALRAAVLDWIRRCTPAQRRVAWEPYPTSLRLMNWCGLCCGKFRKETEEDGEFRRELWHSVYLQAEWLRGHLETYLLGNHLLENGAALAFVGSCFSGDSGKRWLKKGLEILDRQIAEQILPDGMHFERSPMYHVRMTYLMRLLRDTGHEKLKGRVAEPLTRMRRALAHLCHPDGQIALFNDSAFGIYNDPADLLGPEAAPAGPWALPDAGYYGYRGADGTYVICDAGPIGPDYIPGHAHGDIFSFELSIKGQRVIVDSGVYDYLPSEMRQYCRSTRAHNTVEIDGQDQCEFWGAFRVGRRGRPREVNWQPQPHGFTLSGWHDSYRRLPGAPIHHRSLRWEKSNQLVVSDRVRAHRSVKAVSRLHLHPCCCIKSSGLREAVIGYPGGEFQVAWIHEGIFQREEFFYCSGFGRKEPGWAVAVALQGNHIENGFTVTFGS